MTALVLVALVFASYRTWRFVGRDDITEPARKLLPGIVLKGTRCPACLGTWVTVAGGVATHVWVYDFIDGRVLNRAGLVALLVVALAGIVALVGFVDEKLSE